MAIGEKNETLITIYKCHSSRTSDTELSYQFPNKRLSGLVLSFIKEQGLCRLCTWVLCLVTYLIWCKLRGTIQRYFPAFRLWSHDQHEVRECYVVDLFVILSIKMNILRI